MNVTCKILRYEYRFLTVDNLYYSLYPVKAMQFLHFKAIGKFVWLLLF